MTKSSKNRGVTLGVDRPIRTLAALAEAACMRCPLYKQATQVVPGEVRSTARLMLYSSSVNRPLTSFASASTTSTACGPLASTVIDVP